MYHDVRFNASSKAVIDGVAADSFSSRPGQEHSFVCHGQMLAFNTCHDEAQPWERTAGAPAWNIYDRNTLLWVGPFDTPVAALACECDLHGGRLVSSGAVAFRAR
jgi:hypothetical protein